MWVTGCFGETLVKSNFWCSLFCSSFWILFCWEAKYSQKITLPFHNVYTVSVCVCVCLKWPISILLCTSITQDLSVSLSSLEINCSIWSSGLPAFASWLKKKPHTEQLWKKYWAKLKAAHPCEYSVKVLNNRSKSVIIAFPFICSIRHLPVFSLFFYSPVWAISAGGYGSKVFICVE